MMTLLRKIFLSLATLVALLVAIFIFLVSTQIGLRISLQIARVFIPGRLTIGQLNGTLLHQFSINNLRYKNSAMFIEIKQLQLKWQPTTLFNKKLTIQQLTSQQMTIQLQTFTKQKKHPFFLPPFALDLKNIHLQAITVQINKQSPLKINDFSLNGFFVPYSLQGQFILAVQTDSAHLNARARFNKKINVQWQVQIPQFNALVASSLGSLTSQGQINGQWPDLNMVATLNAHQLQVADIKAKQLKMTAHIKLDGKQSSQISVVGQQLQWRQQIFQQLLINLTGTQTQHLLKILLQGKQSKLTLLLTGTWRSSIQQWQGTLKQLTVNAAYLQNWQLQKIVNLQISLQQILMSPLCLTSQQGGVCLQAKKQKNQWQTQLTNGQLNLPLLNLQIRNVQLEAKSSDRQISYLGQASSGNGTVALSGNTLLNQKELTTHLTLKGNNFLASNTPQYKIYISPDLSLQIVPKRMNITGTVLIPQATINPPNYQQTVKMPRDVVYVQSEATQSQQPMQIYSQIKLILGDNIHIAYMGVKGRLTGNMTITDAPHQTPLATGKISLASGVYDAYGQKLTVNPGELNYLNAPITNPHLDIRAYRTIRTSSDPFNLATQQVLAGVQVNGTVDSPRYQLFSEPSGYSQADILSLLITGKVVNQVSGPFANKQSSQQSALLMQAAMALSSGSSGEGGVGSVLGEMQQKLGIEIGTETEEHGVGPDTTQHTAVALGKYITPRLYVSYGMGLLDSVNIIRIRYFLNKFLSLQSESSSLGNAIDLLYNFEK